MTTLSDFQWRLNDSAEGRVTWDNAALAQLERGPNGMVVRDLVRRGQRVQEAAQRQIRLGHVGTGRSNLRYTVIKRLARGGEASGSGDIPVMLVGSEHPRALLHHEGSRPHVIVPRRKKVLVFYADSGRGPLVFAKKVNHPGTSPNRYITDNLYLAAQ